MLFVEARFASGAIEQRIPQVMDRFQRHVEGRPNTHSIFSIVARSGQSSGHAYGHRVGWQRLDRRTTATA